MMETKLKHRFVSRLEKDPKQRRLERGQIIPFLNKSYHGLKTQVWLAIV